MRLDSFHFMRRFARGLTTEHHPLYGTFCSRLSSCVFVWDQDDYCKLREAKKAELRRQHGVNPTDKQVTASITTAELAKHCRRRTRSVEEMKAKIDELLKAMWDLTDTTGLRFINEEAMTRIWEVQQKHLPCLIDPPGVHLYTVVGSLEKGGQRLDVLRCARGSSSLESFHRHQCAFIPGSVNVHLPIYTHNLTLKCTIFISAIYKLPTQMECVCSQACEQTLYILICTWLKVEAGGMSTGHGRL